MIVSVLVIAIGAGAVAAKPAQVGMKGKPKHMKLVEKDPTDWSVVENGAWGTITYREGQLFVFNGHELEPGENYTLITYGGWPGPVVCMGEGTVNENGDIHIMGETPDELLSDDPDIPVKIWLVLSADVNCEAGEMTAWNPTEYLFEYGPPR